MDSKARKDLRHGLQHLGGDSRGQHDNTGRVIIHVISPPAAPHPVRQQDANLIPSEDTPCPYKRSIPARRWILHTQLFHLYPFTHNVSADVVCFKDGICGGLTDRWTDCVD
jgi:hypothetical protein